MAALLMNLTVYPLIVSWTLLGILIFVPLFVGCKLATGWSNGRIMRLIIWIYGRGWMFIMSPFVRFSSEGMENLPTQGPCVLVVNHQSFFDTYCMAMLPIHDIVFAVRAWPFRMFWYRKFMLLAEYLDVESHNWDDTRTAARRVFEKNSFVLFFPEGHRSRDGELQRFYNGAFWLAAGEKVPLVPLCINGTDSLLPPKRLWLQPTTIVLRALPAIDTSAYPQEEDVRRLRKLVKRQLGQALSEIRQEQP
ncbi:MAG: 1-acyl-sn-glycerol-3-phosphate acyltransferase [Desulfuromonas sp.]|nr:MAG: 1-acyl-sn-glycerol-3-phosphate acyltransferase [Desulfuromonas sp.]